MDFITEALPKLYDLFPQPMFFTRNGIILSANPCAVKKHILPGEPVLPILGANASLLDRLPDAPSVELGLRLGGEDYDASATPMEDGWLFAVHQKTAGSIPDDAFITISNALRNPLSNLFSSANMMFPRLEELESPEIRKGMASMNRAAYQLLHIACDLTELRGLSAGDLKLVREKTELCAFFRALSETVEPLMQTMGLHFDASVPTKACFGWIDRQKVTRAIYNLLSNASKYTPKGGQIRMCAEFSGENLLLRVTDNGEGMDSGALATVFSRYLRPASVEDARSGVGFGLPYARRVAQLHGGNLILTSTAEAGTTVLFSMPLAAPEEAPTAVHTPVTRFDYSGGFCHELLEFSDVLPLDVFDSININ